MINIEEDPISKKLRKTKRKVKLSRGRRGTSHLLSLQETLLGCMLEMFGNLIFLETIFSIIGVGLDQVG
jgi:hypothetical protein